MLIRTILQRMQCCYDALITGKVLTRVYVAYYITHTTLNFVSTYHYLTTAYYASVVATV